jgi:hypothetical protein
MGHGPRLFQRHQCLNLQILPGPSLGLLVHPEKLGAGSLSVCSMPDVGTEFAVDSGPPAAANDPQSPRIESSDGLVVEGKIDLDDLAMVIAGAVAGGP